MEEKEKVKNKKIIVAICIALVAICIVVLVCYCMGVFSKDNKAVENTNNVEVLEENIEELTGEEEINVIDIVNNLSVYLGDSFPIQSVDEIDNQKLLLYGYFNSDKSSSTISKDDMENIIHSLLGNDYVVKHENIICPDDHKVLYYYQDGIYSPSTEHGGHSAKSVHVFAKIIHSEIKNDVLEAQFKIIYSNICNGTCLLTKYYKSYSDSKGAINPILQGDSNSDNPSVILTDELFETIQDQVPVTTFRFKKVGDQYSLLSVQ